MIMPLADVAQSRDRLVDLNAEWLRAGRLETRARDWLVQQGVPATALPLAPTEVAVARIVTEGTTFYPSDDYGE